MTRAPNSIFTVDTEGTDGRLRMLAHKKGTVMLRCVIEPQLNIKLDGRTEP